jgi:glutamate carboxypeptidase
MTRKLVLALALLASPLMAASQPTKSERAIASWIDAHNNEAIALLERTVNINSGTHNHQGVRDVGKIFRAELDALGFKTRWVNQDEVDRGGHLVADHPGPGPRILLIGHLDTVFEPDSPFQRFERIDERTARGPGIIDMKGGDVVIVQALKALHANGELKNLNVIVVMTGDEEDAGVPMSKARAALVDAAKGARYAIGYEDGDGILDHAVVARRGTTAWELTVEGVTGHSSQIFNEQFGNGAIFETARILNTIREKLAGQPHLTFNPSAIVGGTTVTMDVAEARGTAFGKTNVIPSRVIVTGDIRGLTMDQFRNAEETMRAAAAAVQPPVKATIAFEEGYPPLAPTPGNSALLDMFNRASQDLGLGTVTAVSPDKAGAADVAFIAQEVSSVIDAVGLKGHDDHSPMETADLSTMSVQTKRTAVLLSRLAKMK